MEGKSVLKAYNGDKGYILSAIIMMTKRLSITLSPIFNREAIEYGMTPAESRWERTS